MSGGAFYYNQRRILDIADDIETQIQKNGKMKTIEELKDEPWRGADWYKEYPENLYHYKYPDEVIEKFKKAVKVLKVAYIYAQRVDWLLSGDDGEESFLERLEQELKQIQDK